MFTTFFDIFAQSGRGHSSMFFTLGGFSNSVILRFIRDHFGSIFASMWDHFATILGPIGHHFGMIFTSIQDHFEMIWGSIQDNFGMILEPI